MSPPQKICPLGTMTITLFGKKKFSVSIIKVTNLASRAAWVVQADPIAHDRRSFKTKSQRTQAVEEAAV